VGVSEQGSTALAEEGWIVIRDQPRLTVQTYHTVRRGTPSPTGRPLISPEGLHRLEADSPIEEAPRSSSSSSSEYYSLPSDGTGAFTIEEVQRQPPSPDLRAPGPQGVGESAAPRGKTLPRRGAGGQRRYMRINRPRAASVGEASKAPSSSALPVKAMGGGRRSFSNKSTPVSTRGRRDPSPPYQDPRSFPPGGGRSRRPTLTSDDVPELIARAISRARTLPWVYDMLPKLFLDESHGRNGALPGADPDGALDADGVPRIAGSGRVDDEDDARSEGNVLDGLPPEVMRLIMLANQEV
jgi:hypothetical protein